MGSILRIAAALSASLPALVAQTGPSDTYADPKVCAQCHREIAAEYARTGMGRSFFTPSAANTIEDYAKTPEYDHALSDSHYSMRVRDGRYFQRRWQLDGRGNQINVEDLKIDYVMGSGNHARSYLHRTERGMLIELPLGWYPDGGGHWGMVPGSDTEHPQTRRFVSYKCMFCHNGYPSIPTANQLPGSEPVFLGELPQGIDCQRCHGPGDGHARNPARGKIVNPAKLNPERRMEMCMQCHLETTSGRIPAVLQRFDRSTFSYVPGQPLGEFAISFDHAPGTGHEGKFEAVSSVYRLRQSRCFLESAGKLECATCHNPHRIPRGEEAVRHYSGICRQCHESAHPADAKATTADCITCHMPKRRVDDAPHVIMTDHLIQRRAPANALAEFAERPPEEYHGEVVPYYPSPLPDTPRNALYRAVAQVGLGNNVAAGLPELARLVEQFKPEPIEFYLVLGDGWKSQGDLEKAAGAYQQALRIAPDSARAMRALAAVDAPHAEQILARAVQVAPADPESWFRYGVLTASAERIQKAISLDPWLPDQSRRLAEVSHSVAALRDALRTDPFDEAAWDVGGRILAEKGEFADAFFDFERAIKLRPDAHYRYDYALALVRADRFDEAQSQAESAVHTDASLVEAHELLGGLYVRKQELPAAAREYRTALALKPDVARVHLRLAMVLAQTGEKDEAATHFREAANGADASVARQAAQALREMGIR
ncbi:MAG TPA: tetratricopeptide repeat protein [Bryobacteraceae bacterium]|nr:tetratricopeptide repeat protein [Bryobacteraceae bacterium]